MFCWFDGKKIVLDYRQAASQHRLKQELCVRYVFPRLFNVVHNIFNQGTIYMLFNNWFLLLFTIGYQFFFISGFCVSVWLQNSRKINNNNKIQKSQIYKQKKNMWDNLFLSARVHKKCCGSFFFLNSCRSTYHLIFFVFGCLIFIYTKWWNARLYKLCTTLCTH